LASFYLRYFGYYERAITIYTHTSDQYSVFGTRVISCSPREALYVLDGLLENDTILRPREHYTDTHGFTEQLFGLCFLLGYSFMPRLRDLADQQLYKVDHTLPLGRLQPLVHSGPTTGYDRVRGRQLGSAVFISDLATELQIGLPKLHEWIHREVIKSGHGSLDDGHWPTATEGQRVAAIEHLGSRRLLIRF